MEGLAKVILKSGKDQSVKRYHPWVFSGAIKKIIGSPEEGDIVSVFDNKDIFLALGHYQVGSIAVRIFTFEDQYPDDNFWFNKFLSAYELRKKLNLVDNQHTNVFRLINAEGDNLPGLIVDYYNGVIVMQIHSIGMYLIREKLVDILKRLFDDNLKAIYDKSEKTIPFKSGVEGKNEYLYGEPLSETILENGNKFKVDWEEGQKTGFFIDQRDNRILLKNYAKNKKVLNMFSYTGGFSVYALQGEAQLVHSVDSSDKAIDLVQENIELNFDNTSNHKAFAMDAFDFFNETDENYDMIILDPPAFAKHQNVLPNALQGYKRLNMKAIEKIKPGGIIFTFSCSQVVSKENFRKSVFAASANTGRKVSILHQLTQPADHPVNIYHLEGEYLKGLILYVD